MYNYMFRTGTFVPAGTNVPDRMGTFVPDQKTFLFVIKKKESFNGVVLGTIMSISSNFKKNLTKESFLVTNGLINKTLTGHW